MSDDTVSDRPAWYASLLAACRRNGVPLGRPSAGPGARPLALRFATGETLALQLDAENHDYVEGWLGRPGAPAFVWFETTDGRLVGINLAYARETAAAAEAPRGTAEADCVFLEFCDGRCLRLPKIAGAAIEYFEGATIAGRHDSPIYPLACGGGTVAVDLEKLMLVMLPARWLDEE